MNHQGRKIAGEGIRGGAKYFIGHDSEEKNIKGKAGERPRTSPMQE